MRRAAEREMELACKVYQYDRLAHKRDEQLALALSPAAYYTENGMAIIAKTAGASGA